MANKYLVLLEFLVNSNSHLNFKFEGKIKFIAVTLVGANLGGAIGLCSGTPKSFSNIQLGWKGL